jgi:hypothetical protein
MAIAAGSLCVFMPLRYAASIMAMLQLVLSTVLCIALWSEVSQWSVDVGVRITGTSAAAATYYTILAFSALIGCLAIFVRAKTILKYFAFCLGWSLGIQLAVSALQLWGYLSTPRTMLLAACVQVPDMNELSCNRAFSLSVGWLIASIVIGLLVQLCSAYVVSSYSTKLSDEEDFTEKAPLPYISQPQAQPAPAADMVVSRPSSESQSQTVAQTTESYDTEKGWAASSRTSTDSDWSENERPPVPMLDPAPPRRNRHPRVRPHYPAGMGPASRDSEIVNIPNTPPRPVPARENPFADPKLQPPPPAMLAPQASSSRNTLADAARMV